MTLDLPRSESRSCVRFAGLVQRRSGTGVREHARVFAETTSIKWCFLDKASQAICGMGLESIAENMKVWRAGEGGRYLRTSSISSRKPISRSVSASSSTSCIKKISVS
jgi:hypothetical protein